MQMVDVIGLFLNSTPPLDFLRHLPQLLHLLCHHHHLRLSAENVIVVCPWVTTLSPLQQRKEKGNTG